MPERKRLFLKILKAEIEDCLEDVEDLEKLYERRFRGSEVTSYVYNENEALLSREFAGLSQVLSSIELVDLDRYASVEDLAASVDEMIQKRFGIRKPQAGVWNCKRKLLKVLRYATS